MLSMCSLCSEKLNYIVYYTCRNAYRKKGVEGRDRNLNDIAVLIQYPSSLPGLTLKSIDLLLTKPKVTIITNIYEIKLDSWILTWDKKTPSNANKLVILTVILIRFKIYLHRVYYIKLINVSPIWEEGWLSITTHG